MEELSQVALAYYKSGTAEERRLFDEFFESMDEDGNGRVSFREFSEFMSQEARGQNMCTRDFFNELDIDGNRGLDFNEVLTLYYILKSGRPICLQCRSFIPREYFTCMMCFKTNTVPYSICLECFRERRYNHGHSHEQFVDNFALLESMRNSALQRSHISSQMMVSYNPYNSQNYPHHAMVPYNAYIPPERRTRWGAVFMRLETRLHFATNCTIM